MLLVPRTSYATESSNPHLYPQATAHIRQDELESPDQIRTPIIALTAHALPEDRERCLASGMDDYLPKPFRAQQLDDLLSKYLKNSSAT